MRVREPKKYRVELQIVEAGKCSIIWVDTIAENMHEARLQVQYEHPGKHIIAIQRIPLKAEAMK